jgi:zinc protease
MSFKLYLTLLGTFFIFFSSLGQSRKKAEVYSLPNGFRVFLSPNENAEEVFGAILINAGAVNDPAEATGAAHYLEHMLFKGTKNFGTINFEKEAVYLDSIKWAYEYMRATKSKKDTKAAWDEISRLSQKAAAFAIPGEFDKLLAEMGAKSVNATTDFDATAYFNVLPNHQIENWFKLQKERFENPVFRLFQSEMEVVLEEKAIGDDMYINQALEKFLSIVYDKHPYKNVKLIGTNEHLLKPSIVAIEKFYDTYYTAPNMVLVLSGNFNENEVKPLISKYFSDFRPGVKPPKNSVKENPFTKGERKVIRFAPAKAQAKVYRVPEKFSKEDAFLTLAAELLSNDNATGLLDAATKQSDFLYTEVEKTSFTQENLLAIIYTPKWFLGSLKKSETRLQEVLKKLKEGDFDDDLFQAAKNNLKLEFEKAWSEPSSRGRLLMDLAKSEHHIDDYLWFQAWLQSVNKQEFLTFVNEFFNENYLQIVNRLGFPWPKKIKKPKLPVIETATDSSSNFYKNFFDTTFVKPAPDFINFSEAYIDTLQENIQFFGLENKAANLVSLNFEYDYNRAKTKYSPILNTCDFYFTDDEDIPFNLSLALQKLGFSYDFYAYQNKAIFRLRGLAENLEEALNLFERFTENPLIDEESLKLAIKNERLSRLFERRQSNLVYEASTQYLMYKYGSDFKNRFTKRELKGLSTDSVLMALQQILVQPLTIIYQGSVEPKSIAQNLVINQKFGSKVEVQKVKSRLRPTENEVYFVSTPFKKQARIFVYKPLQPFFTEKIVPVTYFNEYFDGGMNAQFFKQLRELRSLAYGVQGSIIIPKAKVENPFFIFSSTTNAQKVYDFVPTFNSVLSNKTDSSAFISAKNAVLAYPFGLVPSSNFKINYIEKWTKLGFGEDPKKLIYEKEFNIPDFETFMQTYFSNEPQSMLIVGSTRKIGRKNLKALKVKRLKKRDIFRINKSPKKVVYTD